MLYSAAAPVFPLYFHAFIRFDVRLQTLTVLHERLAVPVVVSASVLVPHVGVVRLGVLVFDPSRGGGDGDDVENNGEEQQQGQDPPAAGVGDPAAEHDRRSEFVGAGRKRPEDELWASAVKVSPVIYSDSRVLVQRQKGPRVWCGYQTRTTPDE